MFFFLIIFIFYFTNLNLKIHCFRCMYPNVSIYVCSQKYSSHIALCIPIQMAYKRENKTFPGLFIVNKIEIGVFA